MRVPKVGKKFDDKLGGKPEDCDPHWSTISGILGALETRALTSTCLYTPWLPSVCPGRRREISLLWRLAPWLYSACLRCHCEIPHQCLGRLTPPFHFVCPRRHCGIPLSQFPPYLHQYLHHPWRLKDSSWERKSPSRSSLEFRPALKSTPSRCQNQTEPIFKPPQISSCLWFNVQPHLPPGRILHSKRRNFLYPSARRFTFGCIWYAWVSQNLAYPTK